MVYMVEYEVWTTEGECMKGKCPLADMVEAIARHNDFYMTAGIHSALTFWF